MNKEEKKIYEECVETQDHCMLCGSQRDLHIHHIRHFGTRRTYKGNLIRLCRTCHLDRVHKNEKKWLPELVDIVNDLYNMDLPVYIKPKKIADTCPYQTIQEEDE